MASWSTADRYAGSHRTPSFGPRAGGTILVLAAAIPGLLVLGLVPVGPFLPAFALVSLAAAGALALVAWGLRAERQTDCINLWDVAGAFAFVGFAAGIISEPEQVVELFGHSSAR